MLPSGHRPLMFQQPADGRSIVIDQTDVRPQLYTRNTAAAEREDHGCLRDESRTYDGRWGMSVEEPSGIGDEWWRRLTPTAQPTK